MITLITIIHIFTVVLLVTVVLLQSGKGAEVSASFGGSSQTVFGSSGGANFFTRFTAGLATVFMVTSITLTLMGTQASRRSVFEGANLPKTKPSTTAPLGLPGGGSSSTGSTAASAPTAAKAAPGNPSAPAQSAPSGAQSPAKK